jgi:hypothetical protein
MLSNIGAEVDIDEEGIYYIMLPYNFADIHRDK